MESAGTQRMVRVCIRGRVQGVWYRGWTVQEAQRRGLSGWVRNRRDGSVEAVFCGPGPVVAEMVSACHRGPPAARVLDVITEDMITSDKARMNAGEGEAWVGTAFCQRPTA